VVRVRLASVLASVLVATLATLIALTSSGSAASPYPAGGTGYDVSWPQCNMTLPAPPYAFGIVGVTGGRAFTHNACLKDQYTWAKAQGGPTAVYINMKYPSGTTIGERDTGPAGTCAKTDVHCQAYNYGYKTAKDAVDYAKTQGVASPLTWWLDIETESTWSNDKAMNAVVISAAIDFLKSVQAPIGIYSTAYQWSLIAGDYKPALPNWVGGASDLADARARCATGAFGGGEVQLVQYMGATYAQDYACTAADLTATPTPTASATVTATATATATHEAALTGGTIPPDGGFGLAVFHGETADDLVSASGCPPETAVFYFTVDGAFVTYIPGTNVASVNASFLAAFPDGAIPDNTAFLGKCA
jgi:hypothetical protein